MGIDDRVDVRRMDALAHALHGHPAVARFALDTTGPCLVVTVWPQPAHAPVVGGRLRFVLPDGRAIVHQREYETRYLYDEVIRDRCYLRHGVRLPARAVVLDIGANIGMFALQVSREHPDAVLHAFEPAPVVYDLLRTNLVLHAPNAVAHHCGVAESDGIRTLTFYPNSSVFSGFSAHADTDRAALRAIVRNSLTGHPEPLVDNTVDQLLTDRLESEQHDVTVRSLDSLLAELDLVKIDAERSEINVLSGLGDARWDRIRQIVIESHDRPTTERLITLLRGRGFDVTLDVPESLRGTGFGNLYCRRPGDLIVDEPSAPTAATTPAPALITERTVRDLATMCGITTPLEVIVADVELPESPAGSGRQRS